MVMKLLIVAATELEIAPLRKRIEQDTTKNSHFDVSFLITGVGMVATTYHLTNTLSYDHYDLVLNVGLGGIYDKNIALGEVVIVKTERFADLGAEDHFKFLDLFDLKLLQENERPFKEKILYATDFPFNGHGLKEMDGITVNTVAGSEWTVAQRFNAYGNVVESMEGAAVFYVCLQKDIPCAEVRAISNYVEPRNRDSWMLKEAVDALNSQLMDWLAMNA